MSRAAKHRAARRPAEWDAHEAFFTPLAVVLQNFLSIATLITPGVVVDLGAGAGGMGQVARAIWPNAKLVAVEVRGSEAVHLRQHYDEVIIGDATVCPLPAADLVVSNPPFSRTRRLVERGLEIVRPHGLVDFLTRQTLGDAAEVEELLRRQPPAAELTISGRVSMGSAGEQTKDQFGYQWLLWAGLRPIGSPWPRLLLPRLPTPYLGWTARPGTGHLVQLDPDLAVDLRDVVHVGRKADAGRPPRCSSRRVARREVARG